MENVFHWSKFKARSHDIFFSWTFDLLLILIFSLYFSPHQINIVYEYKLHGKPVMKFKQTFLIVSDIDVKKKKNFNVKLKKNYLWINFDFS